MTRGKQRLGGMVIAMAGAGFTAWTWYTALYGGYFYEKASMLSPAFLFIGLGLILFPGYREERLARGEDISRLHGFRLLTPRWWAILIIGLTAGGLNFIILTLMLR